MKSKASAAAQHKIDLNHPEQRKFFGFSQNDFLQHRAQLLSEGRITAFLLYLEPQTASFITKYKAQLGETDCEETYNRVLDKFCQEVLPTRDFSEADDNPLAYLSTMLNNAMQRAIDKKKKEYTTPLDEDFPLSNTESGNYDNDLESALNDLERAMEVMCKSCNEIVEAHYWKGLKPAKIAEAISEGILLWLCFGFPICGIRQNSRTSEPQNKAITPNEVSQRLVRIRKDMFNYMRG
jgi:hypothetical protein